MRIRKYFKHLRKYLKRRKGDKYFKILVGVISIGILVKRIIDASYETGFEDGLETSLDPNVEINDNRIFWRELTPGEEGEEDDLGWE